MGTCMKEESSTRTRMKEESPMGTCMKEGFLASPFLTRTRMPETC